MIRALAGLLNMRRSEERRISASVPPGEIYYAIGDIHGRHDLLVDLLERIQKDAEGFDGQVTLVGMGDYIDRGPDSRAVVDTLLHDLPTDWKTVFLRGNHEQAMLDFMEAPALRGEWLAWGGVQALESYGISPFGARGLRDPEALLAELNHALDDAGHRAFYDNTVLTHVAGGYLFVHAGVRPGIPFEKQMAEDLLFIREDFMWRDHGLPYRIVFGHTILAEPLVRDDRIGLDTGAFQSHVLTAVRLYEDQHQILQTTTA